MVHEKISSDRHELSASKKEKRKPKIIKIPYATFRIFCSIIATIFIVLIFSLISITQYKDAEASASSELQALQDECDALLEQTKAMEEHLNYVENKNESSQSILNAQAIDLTEKTTTYQQKLDAFSQMTVELQTKLDELAKAKEEIINKLNDIPYLENFESASAGESSATGMSYAPDTTSDDPLKQLENNLISLRNVVESERQSYDQLISHFSQVSEILERYPTIWPVKGSVSSGYGNRTNPMGGTGSEYHSGLDIVVPTGTNVRTTGGGVVKHAGEYGSYGILIIIDHGNGIETYYGHNSKALVKAGDTVVRGQIVSESGSTGRSTGPHVHYEVRINGSAVNPSKYVTYMES
ncbi:MAG: peptidoglycan DD-metalloendopeptidase family protein [Clostridiales bacterium]|jgi:murein DD-endopeptidase MepM/ murein hydrolase activator NlpD|nr:peptidoglycan DD-metalloendopeptidase family protein [Clostridiales bacterium]